MSFTITNSDFDPSFSFEHLLNSESEQFFEQINIEAAFLETFKSYVETTKKSPLKTPFEDKVWKKHLSQAAVFSNTEAVVAYLETFDLSPLATHLGWLIQSLGENARSARVVYSYLHKKRNHPEEVTILVKLLSSGENFVTFFDGLLKYNSLESLDFEISPFIACYVQGLASQRFESLIGRVESAPPETSDRAILLLQEIWKGKPFGKNITGILQSLRFRVHEQKKDQEFALNFISRWFCFYCIFPFIKENDLLREQSLALIDKLSQALASHGYPPHKNLENLAPDARDLICKHFGYFNTISNVKLPEF